MAFNGKTSCVLVASDTSDYATLKTSLAAVKEHITLTEVLDLTLATAVGGTTVTWSSFTTIRQAVIQNLDSAIVITAAYRTGGGAATTQTIAIPVGEWVKLVDITPGTNLTLTSASGTPLARVTVLGE